MVFLNQHPLIVSINEPIHKEFWPLSGITPAILFATVSGCQVYRRLGFQEYFSLDVYLSSEKFG
jgi:hypothetical protein